MDFKEIRSKIIQHMGERNPESFWYLSTENARQMKTVYSRFENIQDLLEWLDYMIGMQDNDMDSGGLLLSIGGSY